MHWLSQAATLRQLLDLITVPFVVSGVEDDRVHVRNVAPLSEADEDSLTWIAGTSPDPASALAMTRARIVIVPFADFDVEWLVQYRRSIIMVANPRESFAEVLRGLTQPPRLPDPLIHPSALVAPDVMLGNDVAIGAYAIVGNCTIGPGSSIGPYTVVHDGASIGTNVAIHNHCNIGGPGFGYVRASDAGLEAMPQLGSIEIGDGVEIFPYTNVDRGTLAATRIGSGTKIDHYCHIGHNSTIGANSLLTPGVTLLGGAAIGDNCFVGASAVIGEGVVVNDWAVIGMGAIVLKSVQEGTTVVGNPGRVLRRPETDA